MFKGLHRMKGNFVAVKKISWRQKASLSEENITSLMVCVRVRVYVARSCIVT